MKKLLIVASLLSVNLAFSQTTGKATFYHDKFQGRKTKTGEIFSQSKLTCASTNYKMGTKLRITNPKNNKSTICVVNDTGDLTKNHLDLSKSAFKKIGDLSLGVIRKIIIEVI